MSNETSLLLRGGTVLVHNDNDDVQALVETDVLIEGDTISQIGKAIEVKSNATVIECKDKIISPGFIDTHHHVWQTQLKGRHSDDTLLDYHPKGNLQYFNYAAEDVFWGELGGLMEAIDGGTTCIVDHAHMSRSPDHVTAGLSATLASGIRSIFCFSLVPNIDRWTQDEFENAKQPIPDWFIPQLDSTSKHQDLVDSKIVSLGLGFDSYHLPQADVVKILTKARDLGLKLITSHWRRNNIAGMGFSVPKLLSRYDLLGPDILLSHGTGSTDDEFALLKKAGIYVSCTPGTESQMAHGDLVGFRPDVLGSLGADCHSSNPAPILHAMQIGLAVARALRNSKLLADGHFPRLIEPTTLQAFNLATINGAHAVGMSDKIGRLKVGYQADLVIFHTDSPNMTVATQHDPLVAVVRHASVSDIETVIVGGRILKDNERLAPACVTDSLKWEGNESVLAAAKTGKLSWSQVAERLKRSRLEIQDRIAKCNIGLAKQKVLEIWGTTNGDEVMR